MLEGGGACEINGVRVITLGPNQVKDYPEILQESPYASQELVEFLEELRDWPRPQWGPQAFIHWGMGLATRLKGPAELLGTSTSLVDSLSRSSDIMSGAVVAKLDAIQLPDKWTRGGMTKGTQVALRLAVVGSDGKLVEMPRPEIRVRKQCGSLWTRTWV